MTVVRKFLFFLDAKRRGRVSVREMLAHPILHEFLELRRADVSAREFRSNWFSLEHAEMLYLEYLELDADQNGAFSYRLFPGPAKRCSIMESCAFCDLTGCFAQWGGGGDCNREGRERGAKRWSNSLRLEKWAFPFSHSAANI